MSNPVSACNPPKVRTYSDTVLDLCPNVHLSLAEEMNDIVDPVEHEVREEPLCLFQEPLKKPSPP